MLLDAHYRPGERLLKELGERQECKPLPDARVASHAQHSLREESTRLALRQYRLAPEKEIGIRGLQPG